MNELATIAARAEAEGLSFLLGGGHAVITHGVPRSTFDLDLIVPSIHLEKWLRLTEALGYELFRQGPAFVQFNAPRAGSFPLDIMLVNETTYEKLRAEAVPAPASLHAVWVVSLPHLLALKCHAIKHGHHARIVKDAEDVIQLVQKNKLDPEAQNIREIFEKYGTKKFYEKIRRACRIE